MAKGAVYNENDKAAAAWLRELIANNLIAPGDVDERSIKDVRGDDYRGYTQVHAFAGIGLWSAALRASGWDDDRPIWTGSCPCQPFSGAGKGLGFEDPRHLWPDWFRLISELRPDTLAGEQVSTPGLWINLVQVDLEGLGYAVGTVDLPAAGFAQGAHIRQRFYWVADRHNAERWADLAAGHFGDWPQAGRIEGYGEPGAGGATGGMVQLDSRRRTERRSTSAPMGHGSATVSASGIGGMGNTHIARTGAQSGDHGEVCGFPQAQRQPELGADLSGRGSSTDRMGHHHHHPGPSLGPLAPDERGAVRVEGPTLGAAGSLLGCDWLLCHDSRVRPVSAGTFPLVVAHPGRLGLLRGYGNSLDYETAVNFISAYMEAADIRDVMAEYT